MQCITIVITITKDRKVLYKEYPEKIPSELGAIRAKQENVHFLSPEEALQKIRQRIEECRAQR